MFKFLFLNNYWIDFFHQGLNPQLFVYGGLVQYKPIEFFLLLGSWYSKNDKSSEIIDISLHSTSFFNTSSLLERSQLMAFN